MIVLTPWLMAQYYGDTALLEEAYPAMKAYVEYLRGRAKNHLVDWGLGDWNETETVGPPKRTPVVVTSTCAYYHYADIVSQAAELLGKNEEATAYAALASEIEAAFTERFFDRETGQIAEAGDSQTALTLPLALGMIPEENKDLVLQRLVENIQRRKDHLSTGFVGTPYLLVALSDFGEAELAYRIANQRDYPSWTTLNRDNVFREDWDGGRIQMPSCGGSIGKYFYECLAGIRSDPAGIGFKKIVIRPDAVGDLEWVKAHYDSVHGRIVSNWNLDDGQLTMHIVIPPNTTATVHVPAKDEYSVTEGNQPISEVEGIRFLRMENDRAVFFVPSGTYIFRRD